MNVKCILIGAIVFLIVTFAVGMGVSGPLVHEGILDPVYRAHESFWLEELRQDPPDIGALMPRWIFHSVIISLVVAGLYCCFRGCLKGPEWKRGMTFGLCLAIFACAIFLSMSGMFALPGKLWLWWGIDALVIYAIGGAAMGWAVGKWGGVGAG